MKLKQREQRVNMKPLKYTAVLDRIIIEPTEATGMSESGLIHLAVEKEEHNGLVRSVGPDVKHVRVGDIAYYMEKQFVNRDGFICLHEEDILFVEEFKKG